MRDIDCRAIVDHARSSLAAGCYAVAELLDLSDVSIVPACDEVLIALAAYAVLAHDLNERIGRNGSDTQRAAGTDDLVFNMRTVCCCTAGEEECHCIVLHLHQAGNVVAVVPVLVLLELVAAAGSPQLLDLGAGQPADEVEIMDGHIDELAAGARCVLERALDAGDRVLRIAANEDNVTDVAVLHLLLGYLIGVVAAAHEAQHKGQLRVSGDDGLGLLALLNGVCQRLLAENVLAGIHRDLDHLNVRSGVGDDGNGLNVRVSAQLLCGRVNSGNAQLLSDLLCTVEVCICDGCQLGARNAVCDVAGVRITQTAYTDNTNLQLFHSKYTPYTLFLLFIRRRGTPEWLLLPLRAIHLLRTLRPALHR